MPPEELNQLRVVEALGPDLLEVLDAGHCLAQPGGLRFGGARHVKNAALATGRERVEELVGRRAFDLPLDLRGTPFQHTVWAALREVPFGKTIPYGALAARLGRPTAPRAVAAANGANRCAIVVPCHRVVGADGSLTGYRGGLPRKRRLLVLERRGEVF